jgi:hypothetical protein
MERMMQSLVIKPGEKELGDLGICVILTQIIKITGFEDVKWI